MLHRRSRRRVLGALLIALAALAAVDLALTLWLVPDGVLAWRPLPPFSACMTNAQHAWLERQSAELAQGIDPGLRRFDPELGWCPVAGRATPPGAVPAYSYNSIAARGTREYAHAPGPGVLRLACFGDSFTHGEEVGDADTWPAQLEALDARIEALNFGVGAYGTDQALLRARREELHGARVACLGFLIENIGRNVNRYRPLYRPSSPDCVAKPRFVLRGGELDLVPLPYASRAELLAAVGDGSVVQELGQHEHWIAETRWTWIAPSSLLRLTAGWLAYRRREPARLYADREAEPYRVTLELLATFAREARQDGAQRALVIVFPARSELEAVAEGGPAFWSPLCEDLERREVEWLDLTEPLLAAWRAAPDAASRAALFSGGHYSPAANAIVARAVREWLAQRGVLE